MKLRLSDLHKALNSLPANPRPWVRYSIAIPSPYQYDPQDPPRYEDRVFVPLVVVWDGHAWQIDERTQITLIP